MQVLSTFCTVLFTLTCSAVYICLHFFYGAATHFTVLFTLSYSDVYTLAVLFTFVAALCLLYNFCSTVYTFLAALSTQICCAAYTLLCFSTAAFTHSLLS